MWTRRRSGGWRTRRCLRAAASSRRQSALVREAVALLEPTDYVVNRVSALASLAGVLLLSARDKEARELLEQARVLALEKSSPVMLEQLGELDAELTQLALTDSERR